MAQLKLMKNIKICDFDFINHKRTIFLSKTQFPLGLILLVVIL